MKIILAIDSFKGCLSSADAENAAREGILRILPKADIICLPVADGGEGLLNAMMQVDRSIRIVSITTHNPLMQPINTCYGYSNDTHTALIEMATTAGLELLTASERNPMNTTSFGVGEMILDAMKRGCKRLFIGIGGSATNDAGIGMLTALGYRFLDKDGMPVGVCGKDLCRIETIDSQEAVELPTTMQITVVADVNNPLYGPKGAAYIFAPQKGATPDMVRYLDHALQHFAAVTQRYLPQNYAITAGAGAAGGMGFALMSFLHASFRPGIQWILDQMNFDTIIQGADLVITGEGCMDAQTLSGKVPYGILERCSQQHIPVIGIAGKISDKHLLLKRGFKDIVCINPKDVGELQAMQPSFAYQQIAETMQMLFRR